MLLDSEVTRPTGTTGQDSGQRLTHTEASTDNRTRSFLKTAGAASAGTLAFPSIARAQQVHRWKVQDILSLPPASRSEQSTATAFSPKQPPKQSPGDLPGHSPKEATTDLPLLDGVDIP